MHYKRSIKVSFLCNYICTTFISLYVNNTLRVCIQKYLTNRKHYQFTNRKLVLESLEIRPWRRTSLIYLCILRA